MLYIVNIFYVIIIFEDDKKMDFHLKKTRKSTGGEKSLE